MSSVLSYFFGSSVTTAPAASDATTTAPAPAAVVDSAAGAVSSPSTDEESDFVLVDSHADKAMSDSNAAETTNGDVTKLDEAATNSSSADLADLADPAATASPSPSPSPSPSTRSCRPYAHAHLPPRAYGHAHSPPALLKTTVAAARPARPAAPVSVSSGTASAPVTAGASSSSSKRSFADVLAASPVDSSDSASTHFAYAQPASISISEQLRLRMEQLEAEVALAAADAADAAAAAAAADADADYAPPARSSPAVRLPRESSARYDPRTLWALAVDEPKAKRSKRAAAPGSLLLTKAEHLLKAANTKGKPHKQARRDEKESRRCRDEKEAEKIVV